MTNALGHQARRLVTYRFMMTFLLCFLAALVFVGVVLTLKDPKLITGSAAFGPGGFLQAYSAEGYYRFLIELLVTASIVFVAGSVVAAFATTIRFSWRKRPQVRVTNALHRVVDALAALVYIFFVAALFLLILPMGELGAYAVLGTLSAVFVVVVYLALWSRRLPEGLITALDLEPLFQELHTIDLNTSVLEPLVESVEEVPPPAASVAPQLSAAVPEGARLNQPALDNSGTRVLADSPGSYFSGAVLGDVALAAVPGFLGLMGLAQLREGRRSRGLAFLVVGLVLGVLSSWYLILSARIGEFVSGQSMPKVTTLSWLSSVSGNGAAGDWIVISLLGAFFVLWVLQLSDAVRNFNRRPNPLGHA
jgi:hypothetical protein